MAITIYCGIVKKRVNSTLQPQLTASFDVLLKTPTSLHSPTFMINASSFDYNYIRWGDRYYFVTDVVSTHNNIWEVSATVDVLATFKSDIMNTTAYVLYDSTPNSELPDNRLPMKTTKSVRASTTPCPLVPDAQGTYILSITGANDSTGVYKCTASEIAALIDDLNDIYDNLFDYERQHPAPTEPTGSHDVADWVQYKSERGAWLWESIKFPITQAFGSGNLPENIRECKYIPFNIGTTGAPNTIYLGTFKTKQSFAKLVTDTVVRSASVNIPWQANDYRRRAPYTDVYLYIPYIGLVKLSSENLTGQASVKVDYAISVRDGSVVCTVSSGSEILGQYSGNVGASVPIGFSNINIPKAGQAVIEGATAVASKNLGGVGMAAINFGDAVTPNFTSIGGLDGIANIATNQNITCYTVFHDTIIPPNTDLQTIGSPSMQPKLLGTLTGFCQCLDGHVSAAGELEELEQIDNYINSGFFIE